MTMLLPPATPLTILLLAAFVLLLLSVLSTPIIKGIPLATFNDVDYGVFGYCTGGQCSSIRVGYTTNELNTDTNEFNLPSSTRRSLSSILIVHPVAAFMTLVCLCLAAAAHFHAPSHSPRYLLAVLILLLPTLLVTLLAFLVDILLFVPHLQWGGWIVLGATILLVISGVVTCAMRRTLVSRRARKRRIEENAEMNGENYYNRQAAAATTVAAGFAGPRMDALSGDTKEPFVTGSPNSDSGPMFATFRTNTHESDDDLIPLNSQVGPNEAPMPDNQYPPRGRGDGMGYNAEAGNPQFPGPYGPGPGMGSVPGDPRSYSDSRMGSRRGAYPPGFPPRGRGGYPPRGGYGRGGPYGGPRGGRGGPMGPMRGGPPGMMGRGHPPPAGYGPGPGGPNRGFDSYRYEDGHAFRGPSPPNAPRQPSPGSIGMAVSQDAGQQSQSFEMIPQPRRTGSAEPEHSAMLEDQQPHAVSNDGYPEPVSPITPSSLYSSRTPSYIPPRAAWAAGDSRGGASPSPAPAYGEYPPQQQARSNLGGNYYEDADPRFAERQQSPVGNAQVPSALTPGAGEPKPMDPLIETPGSPTTSEISHFTSISERPVNPRWRSPLPTIPAQQKQDILLENNPDFDLRAGGIGRAGAAGVGGRMPPMSIPRDTTRYPLP